MDMNISVSLTHPGSKASHDTKNIIAALIVPKVISQGLSSGVELLQPQLS